MPSRSTLPGRPARLPVNLCGRRLDNPAHVCAFFDSDDEHYAAILPYFAEGIANGEQVICINEKEDQPEHLKRLADANIPVAETLASGQLKSYTPEETYLDQGAFAIDRMIARVESFLAVGEASEFRFTRTCGEMGWALRSLGSTDALMEYEARLNRVIKGHQCTLMCTYDTRKFSRATFKDILSTHPQVLIGNTIVENPYYVSPMEFLKELLARGPSPLGLAATGAAD